MATKLLLSWQIFSSHGRRYEESIFWDMTPRFGGKYYLCHVIWVEEQAIQETSK
jgi:hypothetical protein